MASSKTRDNVVLMMKVNILVQLTKQKPYKPECVMHFIKVNLRYWRQGGKVCEQIWSIMNYCSADCRDFEHSPNIVEMVK